MINCRLFCKTNISLTKEKVGHAHLIHPLNAPIILDSASVCVCVWGGGGGGKVRCTVEELAVMGF